MTRPVTLSQVAERVQAGATRDVALAEFLDSFYSAPQPAEKLSMLEAGMREYLALMSPAEFIHHNIFTEPQPLRRARLRFSPQAGA